VTLHTGDVRAAAVQIDGVWQPLAARSTTIVEVDGPYAVASICSGDDLQRETWLLGPGDGDEHWLPCQRPLTDVSLAVEFLGASDDPDAPRPEVYLGTTGLNDLDTDVRIAPGTYDVVAFERSAPHRFVITRDVSIELDTILTIDFDAAGQPLATRDVTIGGEPISDTVTVQVTAEVGTTRAELFDTSTTMHLFPEDAVDRQLLTVHEHDADVWTRVVIGAGPLGITMPIGIRTAEVDVTLGAPTVTWDTLGHFTHASLSTVDASTRGHDATVAFPGWYEATGAYESLTGVDLATMPGWDPAWRVDPAAIALSVWAPHDDGTGDGAHMYWDIP
jgi:hypothetical protein